MLRFFFFIIFALFAISHAFQSQPRIINGDLSNPDDFPFFVLIRGMKKMCSATLISDRWILTAAHCIKYLVEKKVCLGITEAGKCKQMLQVAPSNQHIYPLYNQTPNAHDIGLIELHTPITFNEHIRPVQLSNTCGMPHLGGEDVVAAGMGRDEMDKKTERSDMRLRHANFVTKSSFFCSFQTNHRMDPNTIICANANHDTNQSVYKGDSGGPLLSRTTGELLGVISFHHKNLRSSNVKFQIFTYVPYYYRWIERRTGLRMPNCNGPQADDFP